MRFCFFFLIILTSSEIPLKVKCFKLLIEGAADLGDRKVFSRFQSVPTFVLHVGKINLAFFLKGTNNFSLLNTIVQKIDIENTDFIYH